MVNAIFWSFVILWMLIIGGMILSMTYQFAYIIQWQIKTIKVLQGMHDDIQNIDSRINQANKYLDHRDDEHP